MFGNSVVSPHLRDTISDTTGLEKPCCEAPCYCSLQAVFLNDRCDENKKFEITTCNIG